MTALLYKNRIDTISTNSGSTDDESNMIADDSWLSWIGDNESSTIISGIFDNPSSPGVSQLCEAVALVHNCPLNTDVTIKLYDGGNADPGDRVHMHGPDKLMPSISSEALFHSSDLDSDGYLIDEGRAWHVYIYYPPVGVVASELDIELSYPAAIDPEIRYVYAGPIIRTDRAADAVYVPGITDYTLNSVSASGNVFSKRRPVKNSLDVVWGEVTKKERIHIEQARLYAAGRSVILDLYEKEDYRARFDRVWGKFIEPLSIKPLANHDYEAYEVACLLSEH